MKTNIMFDIDGTLVDFLTVLETIIKSMYGATLSDKSKFKITGLLPNGNQLSLKKISKAIDETMRCISLMKPMDGAVEFVQELHKATGEPILLVTARDKRHANYTNELISRYFDVPYFLAMVDSYKDKLSYIAGVDYYIEDRRACINYLSGNGKKVLAPIRQYNVIDNPNGNIEFFDSFVDLMPRINEFVRGNA